MPIIIDGYNLLGTCGFIGPRGGPGMLERARNRLLGFLAQIFSADDRSDVTVVFDSAVRLPDTPDYLVQNGIHVHFATGHRDADEMIIDMLLRHSAPKSLLIVSSDHQIQQAAQRRRARFVDSDKWYDEALAANRTNPQVVATAAHIQLEVQLELKEMSAAGADPDQTRLLEEFSQNLEQWVSPARTNPASDSPDSAATSRTSATDPSAKPTVAKQPAPAANSIRTGKPTQGVGARSDEGRSNSRLGSPSVSREDDADVEEAVAGLDLRPTLDTPLKHGLLTDLDEDLWLAALDREFESVGLSGAQPAPAAGSKTDAKPGKTVLPSGSRATTGDSRDPSASDMRADAVATAPANLADKTGEGRRPSNSGTAAEADETEAAGDTDADDEPPAVTDQQVKRWNRQLAETDLAIFPPGYGEDVLFSESFQIDDRLKKKRRPGRG